MSGSKDFVTLLLVFSGRVRELTARHQADTRRIAELEAQLRYRRRG
jgi:hypothetical protein